MFDALDRLMSVVGTSPARPGRTARRMVVDADGGLPFPWGTAMFFALLLEPGLRPQVELSAQQQAAIMRT